MVHLLNEIIAAGGTTAHQTAYTSDKFRRDYIDADMLISCTIAEHEGAVLRFQSLEWSNPDWNDHFALPVNWGVVATFTRLGESGRGVGTALFAATKIAALSAKVKTIDATIRADNTGGLRYYSKMDFVDYAVLKGVPLDDGHPVDRIRKQFDL